LIDVIDWLSHCLLLMCMFVGLIHYYHYNWAYIITTAINPLGAFEQWILFS